MSYKGVNFLCNLLPYYHEPAYSSASLHDLTSLSGPESVNQILNGKECNHGIRIWKVIFGALQRAKLHVSAERKKKKKKRAVHLPTF